MSTTAQPTLRFKADDGCIVVTLTVEGTEHVCTIDPTEAYTLATHVEWLLELGSDRPQPDTLDNLPDHLAVSLDSEPCLDCEQPHDRPVLFVALAHGSGLSDVAVMEVRQVRDLLALPVALFRTAVSASIRGG